MYFPLPMLLLTLLSANAVVANGNSTKPVTDKALCNEMSHLEKLVTSAQNTTTLATKTHNNQTKIDEITSRGSLAAVKLETMQGNSSLVETCAVINAGEQTKRECGKMDELQRTISTASNSTQLAAKTQGNATEEAEWQAKATKAQSKLETLMSNTTLVDACNELKAQEAEAKTGNTTSVSAAAAASSSSSSVTSGAGELVGKRIGSLGSVVLAGFVVGVGLWGL